MVFDTLKDVEKFYKSYAHEVGLSVRVGQHKKGNKEILIKRYYCSREGYRKETVTNDTDESGEKRKAHNVMETRCGCQAHIVVKLGSDKYRIISMVEEHSHGFVSPDKRHLLRSNRRVSERAKSTLFNCHKVRLFFFYCSYSLVGTVSFDMTGQNSNSVSQLASCYIVSPS